MPIPSRFVSANVVNDKIYVIGTIYGSGKNTTQVYDPATDSWTAKTPSAQNIASAASFVSDNSIYLIDVNGFFQIYHPANDSWSTGAKVPMDPADFGSATAVTTCGINAPKKTYFFEENTTYVCDPTELNWSTAASMINTRSFVGAANVNDELFVVGGIVFPPSSTGEMRPSNTTEQYTTIGYNPENSPSPKQGTTPSPSPSTSPTQQPTLTPYPTPIIDHYNWWIPYSIIALAIVVMASVTAYFLHRRKLRSKETKQNPSWNHQIFEQGQSALET